MAQPDPKLTVFSKMTRGQYHVVRWGSRIILKTQDESLFIDTECVRSERDDLLPNGARSGPSSERATRFAPYSRPFSGTFPRHHLVADPVP